MNFFAAVRPNWPQFLLQMFFVVMVGAIVSICKLTQGYMTWSDTNENGIQDWETEKGEFEVDSASRATLFLIAFGVSKAVTNLIVGIASDVYGKKPVLLVGWLFGIAIPIMVMTSTSWDVIVASNVFLGIQQGLCWSLTIFAMVDYAGPQNRGFAVGINETLGYTSVAVFNKVAAALINEDSQADINYRNEPYYIIIAFIAAGAIFTLVFMKDTKPLVAREDVLGGAPRSLELQHVKCQWPNGRTRDVSVIRMSFLETTFMNPSLIVCCLAGLMINFTTAFAWGIMTKWLKSYGNGDKWAPYSKDDVADVLLAYSLAKGLLQFIFGFISDRVGRRIPVVGGLCIVAVAMIIFYVVGENVEGQEDAKNGFIVAAFLLGFGTSMMYPNVIAAVCEHADPSWRASAVGSYRFWRDSGYWIGGLILASITDAGNRDVASAVITTAVIIFVVALLFGLVYKENVQTPIDMKNLTETAPEHVLMGREMVENNPNILTTTNPPNDDTCEKKSECCVVDDNNTTNAEKLEEIEIRMKEEGKEVEM